MQKIIDLSDTLTETALTVPYSQPLKHDDTGKKTPTQGVVAKTMKLLVKSFYDYRKKQSQSTYCDKFFE